MRGPEVITVRRRRRQRALLRRTFIIWLRFASTIGHVIPVEIALIVFACVFGGALLGMFLSTHIPEHHLGEGARDVIKLGMGLIATMTALVLGLVVATAKSSYDAHDEAVKHTAAKVLLLDRVLANYGPETKETRDLLRRAIAYRLEVIWPGGRFQRARLGAPEAAPLDRGIELGILKLSPQNDVQRWLRSQALQISTDILETRWLVLGDRVSSVPTPFLVVVVFWLAIIFGIFGLLAPRNQTVVVVLLVCALSVASSIFLILEMNHPFEGLMRISSAPLHYTLSQLGQ